MRRKFFFLVALVVIARPGMASDVTFSRNCAEDAAISILELPTYEFDAVMDLHAIQIKQKKQSEAYQELLAQTKVTFTNGEVVDFRSSSTVSSHQMIANDVDYMVKSQNSSRILPSYERLSQDYKVIVEKGLFTGSFDEWLALYTYKSAWYRSINTGLRYRDAHASVIKIIRYINSALNRIKPYNGIVRRGASFAPEVVAQFERGKLFSFETYVSTSRGARTHFIAARGENRVVFFLRSRTGRPIQRVIYNVTSDTKGEAEVLLKPHTIFKILDVQQKNFETVVYAEEMI